MWTIMLKEAGDLEEGLPGLSSTSPFDPFKEAGWDPRSTRRDSSWRRMAGLPSLNFCWME